MIFAWQGRARVRYIVGAFGWRFSGNAGASTAVLGPTGFGILPGYFGLRNRRPAAIFRRW